MRPCAKYSELGQTADFILFCFVFVLLFLLEFPRRGLFNSQNVGSDETTGIPRHTLGSGTRRRRGKTKEDCIPDLRTLPSPRQDAATKMSA